MESAPTCRHCGEPMAFATRISMPRQTDFEIFRRGLALIKIQKAKPYAGSRAWRASSSHASASSKSFCLSCASGIRATISRHARAYSRNLAGSSATCGRPQLTGPEISHDDLGKAIGIALARRAQVDDLGHEDFRQVIRRWRQP
jgi:hypothetical protein